MWYAPIDLVHFNDVTALLQHRPPQKNSWPSPLPSTTPSIQKAYILSPLLSRPEKARHTTATMGYDQAGITRSVNSIQNELQYLAAQGVLAPPQLQSIQAQLPASHQSLFESDPAINDHAATRRPARAIHWPALREWQPTIQPGADRAASTGSQ